MDNMVGRANPWVLHKMLIECLAEYLYSTHPLVKAAASRRYMLGTLCHSAVNFRWNLFLEKST